MGDNELSARLLLALGWQFVEPSSPNGGSHWRRHAYVKPDGRNIGQFGPQPTGNATEAFEAIPEPWWLVTVAHVDPEDRYGPIEACLAFDDTETLVFGRGGNYQLAICVATAKALASSEGSSG